VVQMAGALAAAHAAGVLHRDFKPCNVMIVPGRGGVRAVVTDFGVAHALREAEEVIAGSAVAEAGGDLRSMPTTHAGTPAYMAPEQAAGEALGPAADIYALGIVIFEMLTGELPFLGRTSLDTARLRLDSAPPRLRSRLPDVDRRWDEAVARCLSRDPAARYAQVDDVARALAPPPRRRRALWGAAAALAACGGLVAVDLSRWQAVPLPGCPAPALPDLYVAAIAQPGGNGSSACPFRRITDALEVPAATRVVRIAAGRYDAAHGERFPLVVRGTTTIRGAGRDATIVSGQGVYEPSLELTTMIVGDLAGKTAISDLTIKAAPGDTGDRSTGITCDRGNLVNGTTVPPPFSTRLENITLGPGFENGLIVTNSDKPSPSGCNLAVKRTLFHDCQRGIFQRDAHQHATRQPTALDADSNVFAANTPGAAIRIWGGPFTVRIANNQFTSGAYGIYVVKHPDDGVPSIAIEHNHFFGLTQPVLRLEYWARVERFDDNNISFNQAVAVQIYGNRDAAPYIRARRNHISDNHGGVEIIGEDGLPRHAVIDFGRPDDPGKNILRCSYKQGDRPELTVQGAASPGAQLLFHGNEWDHVPPRRSFGAAANTDLRIVDAPAPEIDLGGAVTGGTCMPR